MASVQPRYTTSGYRCSLWHTLHVQHRGEGVRGAASSPRLRLLKRIGFGVRAVMAVEAVDSSPAEGSVDPGSSAAAIAPPSPLATRAASADRNFSRVMLPALSAQHRKILDVAALRDDSAFSSVRVSGSSSVNCVDMSARLRLVRSAMYWT